MSLIEKINEKIASGFSTVDLIVTFKDNKEVDFSKDEEMKKIGRWLQSSGSYVRVQTELSPNDLAELICKKSQLTKEDLTITNAAGMYIPFVQ